MRLLPLLALSLLLVACVSGPPGGLARTAAPGVPQGLRLPFEAGTHHLCVQGGPGPLSHSGHQRFAIDFAMPEGTPVLAVRDGRVVAVKEDSSSGGSGRQHASEGNYVRVLHEDGTHGVYLHLQPNGALVEPGQAVRRGQVIARSGNTGWSSMPHLHFQMDRKDPATGRWVSSPVRFEDVKGDGVPKMLMWYVSGNK